MIPILDSHFHIWHKKDLPWLDGPEQPRIFGPYKPIQRDYLMQEYLDDAASSNVKASVYVQANWPNEHAVKEAAWVQSVANEYGNPIGIVAYANLMSETMTATLEQHAEFKNMCGVRMQLHWHEDPLFTFASAPDLVNAALFRKNLALLKDYDWSFELQFFHPQMADGAKLARDFPEQQFILVHAGMLADDSPEGWAAWRAGMKQLAQSPNVNVKLSGQGTFIHKVSEGHIKRVVDETIELFGTKRCLFGSNFPVEKLWTDYKSLTDAYRNVLSSYSESEQLDVLFNNAARVYKLDIQP